MKFQLLFLAALVFVSCNTPTASTDSCELIDLGLVGARTDSLYAAGNSQQAAWEYFQAGEKNQSSELFVYAAWQYGEAANPDSALIAVKRAAEFGMNSPFILDKAGVDKMSKNSPHREEVDQILAEIEARNNSVDNFEIVPTPISRFWTYFDQALADTANAKEYLSAYICEGSYALRDYYHIRYENVEKMNGVMIKQNPEYYQYVREHITAEEIENITQEAEQMMVNLSKLYPKAVFPKTYLIPDLINGSGTLTELGLFIGVTMFAKSDSMPDENLNDWQKGTITEFENMKFDLVHELMHFQQSYSDLRTRELLVGKLIEEGVCNFLVSLCIEGESSKISPLEKRNQEYIKDPENYERLMAELKEKLYTHDLSKWMHNGGWITDRPSNLGYSIGFLICQSYYENSSDKKKAIYELLNTDRFEDIYEQSDFKDLLE
ncbi:MAG: hypothetical protein AAGC85_22935 [Bacteroidota bacterium]